MIIPYFASFFYQMDKTATSSSFTVIMGVTGISETLVNLLVSHLLHIFSPYSIILIFGLLSSLILYLTSYIQSAEIFCWTYGIALGIQAGGLFLPTLYILWNRYPKYKGAILGLALAFFNLGIIPFGYLFTVTANPLDLPGYKVIPNSEEVIFDEKVASRVPWTIQFTSISYIAVTLLGLALLPSKMLPSEKEDEKVCLDYKEILTNFRFWNIFWMMTFALSANLYIHNLYKVIGLMSIDSDHFNSYIGMANCVSNGLANIFFGYALNKYDWKKVMIVNYLILMFLMGSLWYTLPFVYLYSVWVFLLGLFGGSIYTSMILLSDQDFPKDHRVLSCVCLSLIFIYFSPYVLETFVTPIFGYYNTFLFICAMYGVTIVQVFIHPRKAKSELEEYLVVNS